MLQGELIRQGLDGFASKVVMDTVPYTSFQGLYGRCLPHYLQTKLNKKEWPLSSFASFKSQCCVSIFSIEVFPSEIFIVQTLAKNLKV